MIVQGGQAGRNAGRPAPQVVSAAVSRGFARELLYSLGVACALSAAIVIFRITDQTTAPFWVYTIAVLLLSASILQFKVGSHRIPREVIAVSTAALLALYAWQNGAAAPGGVWMFVSRGPTDTNGAQAHILSKAVSLSGFALDSSGRIPSEDLHARVGNQAITEWAQVRKFFGKTDRYDALVWGNDTQRVLSFRTEEYVRVNGKQHFGFLPPAVQKLKVIVRGPSLSISHDLEGIGSEFMGKVVRGELLEKEDRQIWFQDASSLVGHWKDPYHRAFGAWRQGTEALVEYLKKGPQATAHLLQAERLLLSAARNIKRSANTALFAAILNNTAVVYSLKAHMLDDSRTTMNQTLARSRHVLKVAISILHDGDFMGGSTPFVNGTVEENARRLGVGIRGTKKMGLNPKVRAK